MCKKMINKIAIFVLCALIIIPTGLLPKEAADADEQPMSTFMLGDVDKNGTVTMFDVVALQKHIAELNLLEGFSKLLGDVNEDEIINMQDVVLVQKYIAELVPPFKTIVENDTAADTDTNDTATDTDTGNNNTQTDSDSEDDIVIIVPDDETDTETSSNPNVTVSNKVFSKGDRFDYYVSVGNINDKVEAINLILSYNKNALKVLDSKILYLDSDIHSAMQNFDDEGVYLTAYNTKEGMEFLEKKEILCVSFEVITDENCDATPDVFVKELIDLFDSYIIKDNVPIVGSPIISGYIKES